MGHIEFIGAPGVGKSTLHKELISRDDFYGGIHQEGIGRYFLQQSDHKYRLAYRTLPRFVRSFFNDNLLYYYCLHTAFTEFADQHPTYIDLIYHSMEAATYEQDQVFHKLRKSAEYYQIGKTTTREHETLCLDISFAHRAASVQWRTENDEFSLKEYFDRVPTPDVLIHVHAPDKVCIKRQQERDRIATDKPWDDSTVEVGQAEWRTSCSEISDYLSTLTEVVTVENTGSIDSVVASILQKLF